MEKASIKEKRDKLIKLSNGIKAQFGKDTAINEKLKELYFNDTNVKLNTFKGWLKEGQCVKKGEKAYLFWAKPKECKSKKNEDDEYNYFPICFLFSENQVKKLD